MRVHGLFAVLFCTMGLLAAMALPGIAQQTPWSLSIRSEMLSDEISGAVNDFGDETPDTIWASPTVYVLDGIARPCAAYDQFEVNFFGGRGSPGWDLNVIFDVQRTQNGWTVLNPNVYFNEVNRDAAPVRSWEQFEGARVRVADIQCTSEGRIAVQFEFAASLVGAAGEPGLEMRGAARGEYDIVLD